MSEQSVFLLINILIMAVVAWMIPLQLIPLMIWLERKGAAIIQDRIGPNRANILGVRLFGMLHNIADVIKLMMKEDITPERVHRFYYLLAPFWSMTVALIPLMLVPIAAPVPIGDYIFRFQVADYEAGILLLLAVTGLGVYGIIFAGWSSNNKFSLMGGLRSSAQMISYELAMGLAIVAMLMVYRDLRLDGIVEQQTGPLSVLGVRVPFLPNWGVFMQPVAFVLFVTAAFAETNRTPFDLAEGESELVAGYHTEYSSMKFALFFMAEYANMVVASVVIATLFLGGYQVPFFATDVLRAHPNETAAAMLGLLAVTGLVGGIIVIRRSPLQHVLYAKGVERGEYMVIALALFGLMVGALAAVPVVLALDLASVAPYIVAGLQVSMLLAKALVFCWLYVQVRWTLPRFRYDQLMNLGWKMMIPVGVLNILATGAATIWLRG